MILSKNKVISVTRCLFAVTLSLLLKKKNTLRRSFTVVTLEIDASEFELKETRKSSVGLN